VWLFALISALHTFSQNEQLSGNRRGWDIPLQIRALSEFETSLKAKKVGAFEDA